MGLLGDSVTVIAPLIMLEYILNFMFLNSKKYKKSLKNRIKKNNFKNCVKKNLDIKKILIFKIIFFLKRCTRKIYT